MKVNIELPEEKENQRTAMREQFFDQINDLDPWSLVSRDSNKSIWLYANGVYTYMDNIMYWDGTGIEPVIFTPVYIEQLMERCAYGDDWKMYIEENSDAVTSLIIDLFTEINRLS